MEGFDQQEGYEMVHSVLADTGLIKDGLVDQLVDRLGGLPKALDGAVSYMMEYECPLQVGQY